MLRSSSSLRDPKLTCTSIAFDPERAGRQSFVRSCSSSVGKYELELAPWTTRLTQPLLATAPVRAKNQHTAAFLPGQLVGLGEGRPCCLRFGLVDTNSTSVK